MELGSISLDLARDAPGGVDEAVDPGDDHGEVVGDVVVVEDVSQVGVPLQPQLVPVVSWGSTPLCLDLDIFSQSVTTGDPIPV